MGSAVRRISLEAIRGPFRQLLEIVLFACCNTLRGSETSAVSILWHCGDPAFPRNAVP
jgi:hypothetical protein